jgi:glycosyltransferase involved in cell wall biosynthesis
MADLEAMAASTAIVTSDVYSIPEVTGDTALRFDPHDIDAHVDALERLLENETERRTLARKAHERAQEFTWDKSAANTIDVYRDVLNPNPR